MHLHDRAYLYLRPPSVHTEDGQLTTVDALARARTSTGALSTFEQMMLKKPRSTLDNPTILQLWKANVGVNGAAPDELL
jgi:hypothetical protein